MSRPSFWTIRADVPDKRQERRQKYLPAAERAQIAAPATPAPATVRAIESTPPQSTGASPSASGSASRSTSPGPSAGLVVASPGSGTSTPGGTPSKVSYGHSGVVLNSRAHLTTVVHTCEEEEGKEVDDCCHAVCIGDSVKLQQVFLLFRLLHFRLPQLCLGCIAGLQREERPPSAAGQVSHLEFTSIL